MSRVTEHHYLIAFGYAFGFIIMHHFSKLLKLLSGAAHGRKFADLWLYHKDETFSRTRECGYNSALIKNHSAGSASDISSLNIICRDASP